MLPVLGLFGVSRNAVDNRFSLSSSMGIPRIRSGPDPVTALDRAGVIDKLLINGVAALVKSKVSVSWSLKKTRGVLTLLAMNLVVVDGGASVALSVLKSLGVTGGFAPVNICFENGSCSKLESSTPQFVPSPGVPESAACGVYPMNGLKQPFLGFLPGVAISASIASFSSLVACAKDDFSFASASAFQI
jgi:hypothetical protein